VSFGELV